MTHSSDQPVLILSGPPGAGKTTVARHLAANASRSVHLEADSFFHFIQSGYIEPWKPHSHQQNTVVMGIVAEAAVAYAEAGYWIIVDGIISPGWFFEPLRDAVLDAGYPVAYAVLRPPLSLCIARVQSQRPDRLVAPAVVEQLWQDFADLGPLGRHLIDPGEKSPAELADRLAEGFQGSLLVE